MNLDKATKFFVTHPQVLNIKAQLKSDTNFLANQWTRYENNVYSDFKRKFKLDLSIEQRWHITLAVFESCPYPLDFSLNEFLKGNVSDVGIWSVKARGRFRELGYPNEMTAEEIIYGFPFFPVFMYSVNRYEEIYPNNDLAKSFVNHMQKLETLNSRETINNWYSECAKFIKPE